MLTVRSDMLTLRCDPGSGASLTGALDGDLQLPGARSLGVHLEVGRLLHPEALRLQAAARGPAQGGVTGWSGRKHNVRHTRRRPEGEDTSDTSD